MATPNLTGNMPASTDTTNVAAIYAALSLTETMILRGLVASSGSHTERVDSIRSAYAANYETIMKAYEDR